MKMKRSTILWPLVAVGAAIIGGDIGYVIGSRPSHATSEPSFVRPSDEPIINAAMDTFRHGKSSREALRRHYDINVVYLPAMACVGFNLMPPALGGDQTMCFDNSGKEVLGYRHGD